MNRNPTSPSEAACDVTRDGSIEQGLTERHFASLKAELDKGLADMAAGRTREFNQAAIIERGRTMLADRSPYA